MTAAAPAPFRPSAMFRVLCAHGVDFVVIGGIAMVAHGSTRNTFDLDVTYATDDVNLDALGGALLELAARLRGAEYDIPFIPDGAALRRTWILALHTSAGGLDVLASPPGAPDYVELRRRAQRILVGDVAALVASLEDLEAMKRTANRAKDRLDLEEIDAIRRLEARQRA